jgi:hypothetical protein
MPFETHLLVVANQTLESAELAAELERRARHEDVHVFLLVPALPHERAAASRRLARAIAKLGAAGVPAVGRLGNGIALVAVNEVWDAAVFDEVIVSTLPAPLSSWLRVDLPTRVAELTGAEVRHVRAAPGGRASPRRRRPAPQPAAGAHRVTR